MKIEIIDTPGVNYDAVAHTYDRRVRGAYLKDIIPALKDLARQVGAKCLLDLGCGTGRSLHGLAADLHPPPSLHGLDFSAVMLVQAHRLDPTYRLVQASAPKPPFASQSFDLILSVHAFHHFPNQAQVVQAAYRLLRPGGAFAIINVDPHTCAPGDWWIFDYFEGVREADLRRFPALNEQEAMLHGAGFEQISSPIVQHIDESVVGETIFDSYWLRKDSCSQLILLTDEAYQAGLNCIRHRLAKAETTGKTVIFRTRLAVRMCRGFKQQ